MPQKLIEITICGLAGDRATLHAMTVPGGISAEDAAKEGAARFSLKYPEPAQISVWGHRVSPSVSVREGDRIEITLPLRIEPNEARKLRATRSAAKHQTGRHGSLHRAA